MNRDLEDLLAAFSKDPRIRRIAEGSLPYGSMAPPGKRLSHLPPALIPILADETEGDYLGYWLRYTNGEFKWSYGHLWFAPTENSIREVARTEEQLVLKVILDSASMGKFEDLEKVLANWEIENVEQVVQFANMYGDDQKVFRELPQFRSNPPLDSLRYGEPYDGHMPADLNIYHVDCMSSQEIVAILGRLPVEQSIEEREKYYGLFYNRDLKAGFQHFLALDRLEEAWAYLNSRGWKKKDAEKCLQKFADKEGSELIQILCDWWCGLGRINFRDY